MGRIKTLLRTHTLGVGFLVALVPTLLMLTLQYVWLSKLERASAIAHQASLRSYLEAVGTEIEYFYRGTAERLLNVPATLFGRDDLNEIAAHWQNKPQVGVRRLFVADYTQVATGNYYTFDPQRQTLTSTVASDESLAIVVACLPWQTRALGSGTAEPVGLQVSEHDPSHRIILNPIVGEHSKILGVVGLIVDAEYFRDRLAPATVAKTLPTFFDERLRQDVVVTLRDERQKLVLGKPAETDLGPAASVHFPFVFTDWTLALYSPGSTPEQLAGATFAFNMAVGLLLAAVLLAGIGLALRTADRAMRLSEMKSDFVSNVSHELRTPLASIRVFAELLRLGKVASPDKVRQYGEYIETESTRLSRLIDNILDFSRIESRQKTYRFVPTDAAALVQQAVEAFRVRLAPSGFQLSLELPAEPLPLLELDPDAIGQAVHNLLDNAVKYSGASTAIEVRVQSEADGVAISVRDHGIGIAKEDQAKIFDRFHRVGTGLVHDVKGSGLGLAIVAHIAKVHGGTVSVESELGQGSVFCLKLPKKKASEKHA